MQIYEKNRAIHHLWLFHCLKNHYNRGLGNFRRYRRIYVPRYCRVNLCRAIITGNYSSQNSDLIFDLLIESTNMKKSLLIVSLLAIALAACGKKEEAAPAASAVAPAPASAPAEAPAAAPAPAAASDAAAASGAAPAASATAAPASK